MSVNVVGFKSKNFSEFIMQNLIVLFLLASFSSYVLAEPSTPPNPELTYKLKASVVKVHVSTKTGGHGVGTGVLVGKDLIATNCHVIANAAGVSITKFGNSYAPIALKADWKHDVCLLTFQYLEINPVELGDSETLKYEQAVFSIGFPGGPPKPLVTYGNIKALYALDDSQIVRTDASFIMGASGSPVFSTDGKLIALSTFKSPGRGAFYYNMPVKWIKALIDAPETTSTATTTAPFWDAAEDDHPYFMRVILPLQNQAWTDLTRIATLWLADQPNNAEAHYYLGLAAEKTNNLGVAKQHFEQALKVEPQHTAALVELALMANKTGNESEVNRLQLALKSINSDVADELNETIHPTNNEQNKVSTEGTK